MMLGLSLPAFTTLHVIISLIGIASGVLLALTMLGKHHAPGLAALFLVTTIATSVTGFMFPSAKIGPPHIVGAISLIVLALCVWALYGKHLRGRWRAVYIVTVMFSLYLNAFVGVVQTFQKIEPFRALAPTQSEPPFLVAQTLTLGLFVVLGLLSVKRFPLTQNTVNQH